MTTPYQLNQDSSGGYGAQVASRYGVGVTGGSTVRPGVSAPGMVGPQPGSPMSQVYMGSGGTVANTADPTGARKQAAQPQYLGYDEANLLPTTWTPQQLKKFVNQGILYKLPGFGSDMGMPEIVDAWGNLVDSAQVLSKGGQNWSPYDVMESYSQKPGAFGTVKSADGDWLLDARTGEKIKYVGPRSKTTTSKRVDLSSAEDVKALTTQMLTELLGRVPTADELGKYKSAMGSYEQAHPEMATTTTRINEQGVATDESTTTSGGVSDAARASLITTQAKEGPEYAKYQSATTYWNAFMQMIGG